MTESDAGWAKRALIVSAVLAGVLALFASLWYTAVDLAPMLVGALFGIFVAELAGYLSRVVPLRGRWSVGVTLLLLVLLCFGTAYFLGRRVADQFSQMMQMLPQGMDAMRTWLSQHPQLQKMTHSLGGGGAAGGGAAGGTMTAAVKGVGSIAAMGMAFGVGIFTAFFTGVFLAFSPEFYSAGVLSLVPPRLRPRWRKLLSGLWRYLWLWSVGRLIVMTCIGVAHVIAYWLLGVPLPVALGVIAGVLAFIPYLGPILATVPAALIALTVSPKLALWVIVVHAVVETVESHLLTPLTQKYLVDVPALLTIGSFLFFGRMMGIMGVLVATPLSAALIVITRELYIEGALGEKAGGEAKT